MFFAGMISSYYIYSKYISDFFPINYAMIWLGFTIVSPLLAFICWYAKGERKISFVISAIIIGILFNMTFVYGWIYFDMISILEVIAFICGLIVCFYVRKWNYYCIHSSFISAISFYYIKFF